MLSQQTFSGHNGVKLEIKYRTNSEKQTHKYVEFKQHATENLLGQNRNKRRDQEIHRNKWKWKYNTAKFRGHSESGTKREVYSITDLPQ